MGKLAFPLDAELTGPDRVVLNILKKEYELHQNTSTDSTTDSAEDSDDSGVKHSKFVTPSPEGMLCSFYLSLSGG
ncbi:fatty acid desaturase [Pyrenophora tritici-repentis]|nr:fatty acid desaturase [Pyrenophora tritici-repentis]